MQQSRPQFRLRTLFAAAILLAPCACAAQTSARHIETAAESLARLTPEQSSRFDAASQLFGADNYAGALPILKQLLTEMPGDPFLGKLAAEAAINVGDEFYALQLVADILLANPDDWQAHTLRARIAAQQGDAATRDAEIACLATLRRKGIVPQGITQFPVERVKLGDKSLLIFQSFFAWGTYKTRNSAQLFDSGGKLELRLALESSTPDQAALAKPQPGSTGAAMPLFTYAGYRDKGQNAQGQHMEMHLLFGFVNKQPTYDEMKARFLQLASGDTQPPQPKP